MQEFTLILPEIFLVLTLLFVVIGEITYYGEEVRLISVTAVIGLAGAFLQTILSYQYGPAQIFSGTVSIDGLSLFFKMLFIALGALAIVTSSQTKEIPVERRTEYCALILGATLAMCLAASASNLLLAFLCLQFMNIMSHFLVGYGKRSLASTEAAVKSLVFGTLAGAFLLYGVAILFASAHSLNVYEIHKALLANAPDRETSLVVFMLTFLAICAQIGAFPMYLASPDILEGAPTPASGFLSVGARAAGFAVALRFFLVVFSQPAAEEGHWQIMGSVDWPKIVALVSGMTMMVGSLLAFRQVRAKRMVACLVIAETGFLLMGILVLDEIGVAALLFNLVTELFSLIGVFYVLSFIYDELQSDRLEDLKGMLGRAVPECICLVIFLACLVGLPPTPGFIGKFTLIGAAVRHQWTVLAVFGVISMVLSTIAIARLCFSLIGDMRKAVPNPIKPSVERRAFLVAVMVPMALVGVFAEFVLSWAGKSLGFILW